MVMARGEEDDGLCGDGLRQQVARLRGSKNCVAAETCRRLADVLTYSDAAPAVAAEALAEACACLRRTVDASEGDAEGSVSEDAERLQSEAATLVTRLAEGSPARAEEALAAGGVSACVEALRGCVRRGRAGDPLAAKLALALAVLVAQSVDCRESASAEGVWHAVVPLLALSSAGSAEAALGSRETESWETPSSWGRTVCAEAPRLAGALLAGDASSDIASACLEAGGLGALAVLVLRGEVSACREALRALDSLTSARAPHNQRSRDSLRHGGVLAAAVSRAFAPRSGLVAHGLSLLANLALGNSVNKDAIVAAGALAPAVACLRDGAGGGAFAGTAGESEAARRALAAAKLLAALCQNSRDTAHAAREHGVVVACVRALTVLAMSELALAQASVSAAGGMPPAADTDACASASSLMARTVRARTHATTTPCSRAACAVSRLFWQSAARSLAAARALRAASDSPAVPAKAPPPAPSRRHATAGASAPAATMASLLTLLPSARLARRLRPWATSPERGAKARDTAAASTPPCRSESRDRWLCGARAEVSESSARSASRHADTSPRSTRTASAPKPPASRHAEAMSELASPASSAPASRGASAHTVRPQLDGVSHDSVSREPSAASAEPALESASSGTTACHTPSALADSRQSTLCATKTASASASFAASGSPALPRRTHPRKASTQALTPPAARASSARAGDPSASRVTSVAASLCNRSASSETEPSASPSLASTVRRRHAQASASASAATAGAASEYVRTSASRRHVSAATQFFDPRSRATC
mmetsp:Transcript_16144/g.52775  ORF Transcript_16144/g.52775 Transcript_16144/m.52775 type:complete len:783 (+) Transcript_16144:114-2462(+)